MLSAHMEVMATKTLTQNQIPSTELDGNSLTEALRTSTMKTGEVRTIRADVHGIDGLDTVTVKHRGPTVVVGEERSLVSFDFRLTEAANLADLYKYDHDQSASEIYLERLLGFDTDDGIPGRPASTLSVVDGDIQWTTFEAIREGEDIDPEDLASWVEPFQDLSSRSARADLVESIHSN